jgi:hypothetical protein
MDGKKKKKSEVLDGRRAELQEEASLLSDTRLLSDILAGELELSEREAFESMRAALGRKRSKGLSARQRSWAEEVYVRTFLNRPCDDPDLIKKTGEGTTTFWWELPENRPLRPPGM